MISRSILTRWAPLGAVNMARSRVATKRAISEIAPATTGVARWKSLASSGAYQCRSNSSSSASSSSPPPPPPPSSSPLKSCLVCGYAQPLESLSCPSCNSLQPLPMDIDYYKAMDLELQQVPKGGWDVDVQQLKRSWRLKMALTHPDRMSGRSDKEQQIGAQQSALINRAYETLLNPRLRAQYLLERYNAPAISESDSLQDPAFLMQVMEFREQLEDASCEDEAIQVRAENQELLNQTINVLSNAFSSSPPDLDTARKATIELRYWNNIDKAAREWSPGKPIEL